MPRTAGIGLKFKEKKAMNKDNHNFNDWRKNESWIVEDRNVSRGSASNGGSKCRRNECHGII